MFASPQHALLACLLWCTSAHSLGAVDYYPQGVPLMVVERGQTLCPEGVTEEGVSLGVHWLADEPSHARLLELGQASRSTGLRWVMLLVGTMVVATMGRDRRSPTPAFRGILLDTTRFVPDQQVLPEGSVQTGWHLCFDVSGQGLQFARHGQQRDGRVLPPASLPALSSLGLALWKRGDGLCYALAGKTRDSRVWDAALEQAGTTFPLSVRIS